VGGVRPLYTPSGRGRLLCVGSILHRARDGDVICGSGSLFPTPTAARNLKVHAVRGPRTAALLGHTGPEVVYGDPAQLLPDFYPVTVAHDGPVVVIPHHTQLDAFQFDDRIELVSPLRPWTDVVRAVCGATTVVSSSLHGLIVAEAYGVPAVWLAPPPGLNGGHHKYFDYFEGSGREAVGPPQQLEAALIEPVILPPPRFDNDGLRAALGRAVSEFTG
jgi:pyruvyltransferase